jgi:hypothetical protein
VREEVGLATTRTSQISHRKECRHPLDLGDGIRFDPVTTAATAARYGSTSREYHSSPGRLCPDTDCWPNARDLASGWDRLCADQHGRQVDRAVVVSTVREAFAAAAATARSPAPAIPSAASATIRVPFAQATAQQGVPVSRGTAGLVPVTSIAGLATWDRTARTPASTAPVGSDTVARAVLSRATSCRQSRTRDARSAFCSWSARGRVHRSPGPSLRVAIDRL